MNIREIQSDYRAAKAMPHSLARARKMAAIQRAAKQSRSRLAAEIECCAHLACVMSIQNVPNQDHATRSELGRIKRESQFAYNGL